MILIDSITLYFVLIMSIKSNTLIVVFFWWKAKSHICFFALYAYTQGYKTESINYEKTVLNNN